MPQLITAEQFEKGLETLSALTGMCDGPEDLMGRFGLPSDKVLEPVLPSQRDVAMMVLQGVAKGMDDMTAFTAVVQSSVLAGVSLGVILARMYEEVGGPLETPFGPSVEVA